MPSAPSPTTAERPPALESLQSARGLAAFLVAAFHLSITFGGERFGGVAIFQGVTWWGFRGVDFFFVLSGFIILLAHKGDIGRPERLGRYAWKRVSRIYPAYWFWTIVVVAISAVGSGAALASLSDPATLLSSLTLVRFGGGEPPVGVAWTLFHEMMFYAFFCLLVLDRRVGIGAFALWGVAILGARIYPTPHDFTGTLIGAYNANFFFGMGACLLFRQTGGAGALPALIAGLVLLPLMILADARGGGFLVHLGFALAFTLGIYGAAGMERRGWRMSLPGLTLLGDASYSVYLTHVVFQTYIMLAAARLGLLALVPTWLAYFGVLIAATLGGILAYLLVEKPLLAVSRDLPARFKRPKLQRTA